MCCAPIYVPVFVGLVERTISLDINNSEKICSTANKYGVNAFFAAIHFWNHNEKNAYFIAVAQHFFITVSVTHITSLESDVRFVEKSIFNHMSQLTSNSWRIKTNGSDFVRHDKNCCVLTFSCLLMDFCGALALLLTNFLVDMFVSLCIVTLW